MVGAVRYRVGQFLQAVAASRSISEERVARATGILTPEARALFARQAAQDQHHALAVYDTLRRSGHTNAHLLAAALLHDVGKAAAQLSAWQRGSLVLAERFAPRSLERLLRQGTSPWQRLLVDYARHAAIGARWAEEAGCSPLTVALIRRHEDSLASEDDGRRMEEDRLLAALQAADSVN